MKARLTILLLIVSIIFGCNKFDDSNIWNSIDSLDKRVERLETICDKMNTNISSLQTIVQAIKTNDSVKSVTSLPNGGGYTINFVSGKSIIIYNGLKEQFFYSCTLYVPKSAIDNYKSDNYWGKFKNILPIVE